MGPVGRVLLVARVHDGARLRQGVGGLLGAGDEVDGGAWIGAGLRAGVVGGVRSHSFAGRQKNGSEGRSPTSRAGIGTVHVLVAPKATGAGGREVGTLTEFWHLRRICQA